MHFLKSPKLPDIPQKLPGCGTTDSHKQQVNKVSCLSPTVKGTCGSNVSTVQPQKCEERLKVDLSVSVMLELKVGLDASEQFEFGGLCLVYISVAALWPISP